jgi:glycosyltransferase involved in cell wall biosynthesis
LKVFTISYNAQTISWGPAVHFQELWNSFSQVNNEVRVIGICPYSKGDTITELKFNLIKLWVPDIRGLRQIFFDFVLCFLYPFLRLLGFTIYIRLSRFHLFSLFVLKLFRLQYFIELNGIAKDDAISGNKNKATVYFAEMQEKFLIAGAMGVIAVSSKIGSLASRFNDNVAVVKNRVSSKFFSVKSELVFPVTMVYVGTYTPWDGHELLPELAREFSDVNFLMIGEGVARQKLMENSPKNMEFVGKVDYLKLCDYYSRASGGIVLYEQERHKNVELTSLKTLEYVASGLPVFTTRVSGQEFIEENLIGMCIYSENMIEDFRTFLRSISEFKKNINQFRKKTKEELSWFGAAQETYDFLEQSIG